MFVVVVVVVVVVVLVIVVVVIMHNYGSYVRIREYIWLRGKQLRKYIFRFTHGSWPRI